MSCDGAEVAEPLYKLAANTGGVFGVTQVHTHI